MKLTKIVFVTGFLFFFAGFSFSQPQSAASETEVSKVINLSVEDAVVFATDNNISVKTAKNNLDLLKTKKNTSWNSASPSLSASGNLNVPVEKSDNYTYGVSVSASIRLTTSLYTQIREAKLNYESGKTSYEDAVRTVELNVRKAFYNLLYAKENIALQQRNMETAKQRYESNLDKFKRGQLSEIDMLTSQVNYETLKPKIDSLIIEYDNSLASFKQMLGLEQNSLIELQGSLEDLVPPEEFTIDLNYDSVPAIRKLNESIEKQKNSLMATRFSAWGPSITASYSLGETNGADQKTGNRTWIRSNQFSLGVSIPLDGWLPWSSGAMSIETQKTTLENLELQLEDEKTSVAIKVQNSTKKILQQQSQLDTLKKTAELAQKTYDMTLKAYNHGSKDLLTLQNASDSLMSAKVNLQQQMYNLISEIMDLENTLGIPFGSLSTTK